MSVASVPSPGQDPLEEWVRSHQGDLYWYLRYLRCPRELAEDLLQETLLLAIDRPLVLRMQHAKAKAWLRTAARNRYLSHLRREARRPAKDADVADAVWEETAADAGRLEALRACIARLDGRARQILELAYRDGCGREEIGREVGLRPEGVKTLLQRLRAQLRRCVETRMEHEQD